MTQQKARTIIDQVFRAGVGFERGESMSEHGHLKTTPVAAERQLCDAILEIVGEDEPEMEGNIHLNGAAVRNKYRAELRLKIQRFFDQPSDTKEEENRRNEKDTNAI